MTMKTVAAIAADRRRLGLALAAGLAAFALGAALALAFLPEWRSGPPAAPGVFAREYTNGCR